MAVNLAKKYSKQIEQIYTLGSLTKAGFSAKYDFIGVKTAAVYTLTSQALDDYTRTGANRFGTGFLSRFEAMGDPYTLFLKPNK